MKSKPYASTPLSMTENDTIAERARLRMEEKANRTAKPGKAQKRIIKPLEVPAGAPAKMAEGSAKIENGSAEIKNGLAKTENGLAEIENGSAESENGLAKIENGSAEIEKGLEKTAEGSAKITDGTSSD
jgi:uncharacterized phage infection (PIP) family protein YhgE